jgi:transposase
MSMTTSGLDHLSKPELIAVILQMEPRLAALEAHARVVESENAALRKRNTELETELARLRKDSSNSSKPPSSDIVKPPKPPCASGRKKRRIGGQPGHPRHERVAFPPEQIDAIRTYKLNRCPDCGGRLKPMKGGAQVIQQVEIVRKPVRIVEHRAGAYWCVHCGRAHAAPMPAQVVKCGLMGPDLTALVAYLKGVCHASFSTVRKYLRDVMGVTISRGQLAKLIAKVSAALADPYQQLLNQLPSQPRLNVDETGHKDNGKPLWTWCFRAELFTLFKIQPSRGSAVLLKVLGDEFDGVLGCDYFSAYRKYMKDFGVAVQFCLAHLIREVKFLLTLPDPVTQNYAQRLLKALRQLFRIIHRREEMTPERFQRALERARKAVLKVGRRAPARRQARNLAKRFRQHGAAYFRFITAPGMEPTNNLAEQAIRFVVIDRRITQGTRSEIGRQWNERIWTTIATLTQQGRSILAYLRDAFHAYLHNQTTPALLPAGP